MTRIAAVAALALALLAGTARADTFAPLPDARAPLVLPSSDTPNVPGSLVLPPNWTASASSSHQLSMGQLQALWMQAGAAYGIPWQVLGAINKIETNFGQNMGPSSAGAVGWMQFMPETWLRWGTDGDGDGMQDPWNPYDGVYSAARYLAAAGAREDLYRGIFAYNHADWYVRDVLDLARLYEGGGPDAMFELDQLEAGLDEAENDVSAANQQLVRAVRAERRLARLEESLHARADAAELLSDSLELRKQAVQAGVRRVAAKQLVYDLRARLAEAEDALAEARADSSGAAFAVGGSTVLEAPSYSGGYVFPVGGGASVVSVSHHHHDYPAADIAAPEGSPVYAFADSIVKSAWSMPDPRCGIGATIETGDGRVWTFCHLSYLDPGVRAGVVLSAGSPIGLVGSTGRSTGPHLHLQLHPANAYPQDEAWFRSFAGTAFTWQDGDPGRAVDVPAAPAPQPAHPVFAVVPTPQAPAADDVVAFTR